MKLETIASPASRSERGLKLQSGFGWTPGALGAGAAGGFRPVAMGFSSSHRQAEVALDFVREVGHELAVVGRDLEVVPGERLRRGAGDHPAVAGVLRAVARAREAVSHAQRRPAHL